MITAEAKAATKKRIQDALAAIATLRNIATEATEAEDFLTLNIIASNEDDATPLNNVRYEAAEALDKFMEADEEHSMYNERDLWDWWTWADEQFPNTDPFSDMAANVKRFLQEA